MQSLVLPALSYWTGCTAPNVLDTEDNICKSIKYDNENPCSIGTFNSNSNSVSITDCIDCTAGSFCQLSASISTTGLCDAGYYCTGKAIIAKNNAAIIGNSLTGDKCDIGEFCTAGSTAPSSCTVGNYCADQFLSAVSNLCEARYYCDNGAFKARPTNIGTEKGDICPAGNWCTAGSTAPTACLTGQYQPLTGAAAISDCLNCPPGSYCNGIGISSPSGLCSAGFFCPGSNTSPTPATNVCNIGYMCPAGSTQQIKCDEGTFQSSTAGSTCPTCSVGKYCFDTSFEVDCEAGNWCPGSDKKKACFPGKYGQVANVGLTTEAAACSSCPTGFACERYAMTVPTACTAGYYCGTSSTSSIPRVVGEGGGRCQRGYYCPTSSSIMIDCPGGKYCANEGLSETSGSCESGYYCTLKAQIPNPIDGTTGDICPSGKYCPQGTTNPINCPIGTYRDAVGGTSVNDCYTCLAGTHCQTLGLVTPSTGTCAANFYCPDGQSLNNPPAFGCEPGYYCPAGAEVQFKCELGFYQPAAKTASCLPCDSGKYCDQSDTTTQKDCLIEGTYRDAIGATQVSDCTNCPVGYYCNTLGATSFSLQLMAGYYSTNTGITKPNPTEISGQQGICTVGNYCPTGSGAVTPCPVGTYNDATGGTSLNDCLPCPPGKFCNLLGTTMAILVLDAINYGNCDAGYVCFQGSNIKNPVDNIIGKICPVGNYCPAGTYNEIECPTGSYQGLTGQASCLPCPAGFYCNEKKMSAGLTCPQGYFCPSGSVLATPCPRGSYSGNTGNTISTDCTACDATYYCDAEGMIALNTAKKCAAGYICDGGSPSKYPPTEVYVPGGNAKCPKGNYCVSGAAAPVQCSIGEFQNSVGASNCKPCPPGYYCATTGLQTPTGKCTAGYICLTSATVATPTDGTTGDVCPIGSYCASGSAYGLKCEDGTKQILTGQSTCDPCAAGTWCKGSTEFVCQIRKYCPAGSVRGVLCGAGTYNLDQTNYVASTDCLTCPARKYCIDGTDGSDFCESGGICESGALTPIQTQSYLLGRTYYLCPLGSYCEKPGDSKPNTPLACPSSKYTYYEGANKLSDCLACQAGSYCVVGSVPQDCPAGAFCVKGSTTFKDCAIYFYNPSIKGINERDCEPCAAGYYCDAIQTGVLTVADKCSAGNYCPEGSTVEVPCPYGTWRDPSVLGQTVADCQPCSVHYYCPKGSSVEIPCPAGTKCPVGSGEPLKCEAGYWCEVQAGQVIVEQNCPIGSYCPQGIAAPIPCNPTSLCATGGNKFEGGASLTCPAGMYLSGSLCKFCNAGFICNANSNTANPVAPSAEGYECPQGNWCDSEISITPIQCPLGTYRNKLRGKRESDCFSCPAQTYSSSTGQSLCNKCGTGATSVAGSSECTCIGKFRVWLESTGYCSCQKGYEATDQANDELDCAPVVLSPCRGGKHRDHENKCVDCSATCGDAGFSYDKEYAICKCDGEITTADEACDSTCLAQRSTSNYDSATGQFCIQFPGFAQSCQSSTALNKSSSGFGGAFEPHKKWTDFQPGYTSIYSRRRNLDSDRRDLAATVIISQPLICLTSTDAAVWQVSKTSFPVYLRNHPLNQGSTFDDGEFIKLQEKLLNTGLTIDSFAYVFPTGDAQTIVFSDYSDSSSLTVVYTNQNSCPVGNMMPLTAENLKQLGISAAQYTGMDNMSHWYIIVPIIFCFIALLMGVFIKRVEIYIHNKELEEMKKKEYTRKDGSVDRIQYLRDLYQIIKRYLGELKDDDPVKLLIQRMEKLENRDEEKEEFHDLEELVLNFFNDL